MILADQRPYAGLRILDFTTTLAGPHCTRMLADMGAIVIKVEPPEGEMMRYRLPRRAGHSSTFGDLNAGKLSVALDLKSRQGREAARALVKNIDVLVENFRPGVMSKLGLDYDTLCQEFPSLIYCSISGYGQTGPSAGLAAYAPVIHASSGYDLAHLTYQEERSRPDFCGLYVADVLAGTYALAAIGAALNLKHKTGMGRHIDVSMLESMLTLMPFERQGAQFELPKPSRPFFGPIKTADGYVMLAIGSEKSFRIMSDIVGRPELVNDPRFSTYTPRRANWAHYIDIVEQWSHKLSTLDCMAVFEEKGIPASLYRTVKDALDDKQLEHRGSLATVRDAAGSFKVLNPPFKISGVDLRAGEKAAELGEHTDALLTEAGLSSDKIKSILSNIGMNKSNPELEGSGS